MLGGIDWQPIETAPEGVVPEFLVWTLGGGAAVVREVTQGADRAYDAYGGTHRATHWAPINAPDGE